MNSATPPRVVKETRIRRVASHAIDAGWHQQVAMAPILLPSSGDGLSEEFQKYCRDSRKPASLTSGNYFELDGSFEPGLSLTSNRKRLAGLIFGVQGWRVFWVNNSRNMSLHQTKSMAHYFAAGCN
jgi:hypothetical protein